MEIAVAIAVDLDFRDNCRVSEDCRGWPWKLLWFDARGNCRGNGVDFRGNCRVSEDCRGSGRGWPRMAVKVAVV